MHARVYLDPPSGNIAIVLESIISPKHIFDDKSIGAEYQNVLTPAASSAKLMQAL
jgi:hypothetical protein